MSAIWSKRHIGLHVKYPLFLSDFNETRTFSTGFRKVLKHKISWKFFHWEPSCSMRMDRRDGDLRVAFRNIANAPRNMSWKPNNFWFVFPKTKTDRTVIPNSETLFQFSAEIPLLQDVQTGSMAHPASYSVGTGVLSQGKTDRPHTSV